MSKERVVDLVTIDEALSNLAKFDPQKSRIVEMKFFGGLSTDEVRSLSTFRRERLNRNGANEGLSERRVRNRAAIQNIAKTNKPAGHEFEK